MIIDNKGEEDSYVKYQNIYLLMKIDITFDNI